MRPAKLCVTVTADTMAELRTRRDQVTDADLVELRLDTVRDPSAAGGARGPQEAGDRHLPAEVGRRALRRQRRRASIDPERGARARRRVRRSRMERHVRRSDGAHRRPPRDPLASRLRRHAGRPRGHGAGDAVERRRGRQARGHGAPPRATASRFARSARSTRVPMSLIAMGEAGPRVARPRRLDGIVLDLRRRRRRRPGQISAQRMQDEFDSGGSARAPRSTAWSASRSRIRCHRPCTTRRFAPRDLDAVYLPLAAADFDDFVAFADAAGLAGVSVTAPFKVDAFERADECDPVSRRIQSVNTLRRDGGKWLGCNTDVDRIPGAARVGDAAAGHARDDSRRRRRGAIGVGRRWPRPA